MVLPESTADVQATVKILVKEQCPFGIKAGGHSAWEGSSGIAEGVTVDFEYMNTTSYDSATGIVSIQPGARWGSVYELLDPYNVTVVGARTSVVGVGGFTTGGGYSFHSNSHGFACDNVVNWEIVLADGSVVNANTSVNSDLWRAQKGGSGNLGFVTRIDQKTVEGTQLWGGFTSYNLSETENVFNAYLDFVENTQENSPDQVIIALYYDNTGFSIRSILTNNKGIANGPTFNGFLALPNISSTLTVGPESEIIPQFTGPTPLGLYANWFTGTATNSFEALSIINELHSKYVAKIVAAAHTSNFSTLIEFQPVTNTMVRNSNKRGGNILGLEPIVADSPVLMWLVALTVDTEENQAVILPIVHQFVAAINQNLKDAGRFVDWIYLNYAWGNEKPYSHYGRANLDMLAAVSNKYDPNGVFQNLHQTGFKFN
ncbi:FAD-binding, type 2 [Xylogone sp. PMI_703]|nr:FAD-binding, type 2 [Xylogone sp. PMI_703]